MALYCPNGSNQSKKNPYHPSYEPIKYLNWQKKDEDKIHSLSSQK